MRVAWIFGSKNKNSKFTSKEKIIDQLHERRALPIGRAEFEEWSDRIIAGAMVTATEASLKWTLANLLLHLGPTESHKEDAFFIHSLRKFAVNETADAMRTEIRAREKARMESEGAKAGLAKGAPHPLHCVDIANAVPQTPRPDAPKILEDQNIPDASA